jgi:hypothetical protein
MQDNSHDLEILDGQASVFRDGLLGPCSVQDLFAILLLFGSENPTISSDQVNLRPVVVGSFPIAWNTRGHLDGLDLRPDQDDMRRQCRIISHFAAV